MLLQRKRAIESGEEEKKRQKRECRINQCPLGVLTMILSKTGSEMMLKVRLVCKRWNKACENQVFYEAMLEDVTRARLEDYEIAPVKYDLIPEQWQHLPWRELFAMKRESVLDGRSQRFGTIRFGEDGFYEGEVKDGKFEGKGILYKRKLGKIYEGDFKEGKVTGEGRKYFSDGGYYQGEFQKSRKCGFGRLYMRGIGEYVGQFADDRKEGEGEMNYYGKGVYKGEWKRDKAHGKGVFKSILGFEYEGEWQDNMREGYGVLRNKRGTIEGHWKNDMANGKAKITFTDGSYFEGELKDNKWNGQGCYVWSNGKKYVGSFKNGLKHGYGELMAPGNEFCYKGHFKDDIPHGDGTLSIRNVITFAGKMKKGKNSGFWEILDEKGDLLGGGNFLEGKLIEYNLVKAEKEPLKRFLDGLLTQQKATSDGALASFTNIFDKQNLAKLSHANV